MRKILLSLTLLVGFASQAIAADNYAATAGSGLTFGAKDAAGVLYSRFIGCDNTTVSQCWTVAASGADAVSNTTTQLTSGAFGYFYNGTTWDRMRGDTTNGLWVNVKNTLTAVTPGDGITTTIYGTAPASPVIGVPLLWNGTTYDRQKSAGATGIAAVATLDPCQSATVNSTPINISTATTTRIATESASVKIYICHLSIVTAAANNVALIEGTGASCAGGTPAGMAGGTSAASGWNFSANGGISLGMGGYSINQTANQAYSVCLVTSAATQLSGVMKWVAR